MSEEHPAHEGHGPPYITKEAFGVHLFEAVRLLAGIESLDHRRMDAERNHKETEAADLLARRRVAMKEIPDLLSKLEQHETDQVLDRFAWLLEEQSEGSAT